MTRVLREADVIRLMREEWHKRIKSVLIEAPDVKLKTKVPDEGEKIILTPELKVRHKSSKIRYTIDSVGPRDVILRTPEGETFIVDAHELEEEYELD